MLWIQYPLGPWTGRIASGLWLGQAGTKYKSISGSLEAQMGMSASRSLGRQDCLGTMASRVYGPITGPFQNLQLD